MGKDVYVVDEDGRVVTEELAKTENNEKALSLFALVDRIVHPQGGKKTEESV